MRNLSLSKYDYNKAGKRNSNLTIALTELEECLADTDNVESVLEKGELAKHISDFLRTLPLTQRQIFVRRYWYTDSIKTIASQFGYSESKIKSMLFRTRNQLKLYLEKEGIHI